jgi:hypothetical protein
MVWQEKAQEVKDYAYKCDILSKHRLGPQESNYKGNLNSFQYQFSITLLSLQLYFQAILNSFPFSFVFCHFFGGGGGGILRLKFRASCFLAGTLPPEQFHQPFVCMRARACVCVGYFSTKLFPQAGFEP